MRSFIKWFDWWCHPPPTGRIKVNHQDNKEHSGKTVRTIVHQCACVCAHNMSSVTKYKDDIAYIYIHMYIYIIYIYMGTGMEIQYTQVMGGWSPQTWQFHCWAAEMLRRALMTMAYSFYRSNGATLNPVKLITTLHQGAPQEDTLWDKKTLSISNTM